MPSALLPYVALHPPVPSAAWLTSMSAQLFVLCPLLRHSVVGVRAHLSLASRCLGPLASWSRPQTIVQTTVCSLLLHSQSLRLLLWQQPPAVPLPLVVLKIGPSTRAL